MRPESQGGPRRAVEGLIREKVRVVRRQPLEGLIGGDGQGGEEAAPGGSERRDRSARRGRAGQGDGRLMLAQPKGLG